MVHFLFNLLAASILVCEAQATVAEGHIEFKAPVEHIVNKGSEVHFSFVMHQNGGDEPTLWKLEYFDGKKWVSRPETFSTICTDRKHLCVVTSQFKLAAAVSDTLRSRAVVVPGTGYHGKAGINSGYHGAPVFEVYEGIKAKDTREIAVIGNSFTFYYYSWRMLSRIARSQGHRLRIHASLRGGLTLGQHLERTPSLDLVKKGRYDYVLLQDQSMQHAYYTSKPEMRDEILGNTRRMAEAFRKNSPKARIILESTWAYPTKDNGWMGYGDADAMQNAINNGSDVLAKATGCEVSPIGEAARQALKTGIEGLYTDDLKHNNLHLSYLKACVNYLIIYGGDFDANVPDFGIDGATARKLREIAVRTVAGK